MAEPDLLRGDARRLEGRHDAAVEEWLFACWVPLGGAVTRGSSRATGVATARPRRRGTGPRSPAPDTAPARRRLGGAAPARPPARQGAGLWAEHVCDAPMEQWTVANETFATALDDPDEALGRGYGTPTALAFDLEWYALAPPSRGRARAAGTGRPVSSTA